MANAQSQTASATDQPPLLCAKCGYDLRGIIIDCPECGYPVAKSMLDLPTRKQCVFMKFAIVLSTIGLLIMSTVVLLPPLAGASNVFDLQRVCAAEGIILLSALLARRASRRQRWPANALVSLLLLRVFLIWLSPIEHLGISSPTWISAAVVLVSSISIFLTAIVLADFVNTRQRSVLTKYLIVAFLTVLAYLIVCTGFVPLQQSDDRMVVMVFAALGAPLLVALTARGVWKHIADDHEQAIFHGIE